jgi:hypothetical protein
MMELIATTIIVGLSWRKECDRPLVVWCLVHSLRFVIIVPIYIRRLRNIPDSSSNEAKLVAWTQLLDFGWFIVGQTWFFGAETCQETNKLIYYYTMVLVILIYLAMLAPLLLLAGICLCLPCVLIVLRVLTPNPGASQQQINHIPVVRFDPATYRRTGVMPSSSTGAGSNNSNIIGGDVERGEAAEASNNDVEAPSCAICMEDFTLGQELRVLPCHHDFHKVFFVSLFHFAPRAFLAFS